MLVITVHLSESDNVVRTGILPISLSDNVDIKQSSGALLIRPLSRSPPAIPRGSHSLVRAEAEREQNPGHRAQTRILVDPCHPGSELWPIAASRARPHAARAPLLPPATAGVGSAGRPRCGPHQARRYRSEPSTSPCSPATAGVGSAPGVPDGGRTRRLAIAAR